MRHFTRLDFTPALPATAVRGVRVLVSGSVAGIVVVITPEGDRTFGGPIHGRTLTEYATIDEAQPIALPTDAAVIDDDLIIAPLLMFPSAVRCTAIVLHHESANGKYYTLRDFLAYQGA